MTSRWRLSNIIRTSRWRRTQLLPVTASVEGLQVLDSCDIVARLGERDAFTSPVPLVDVLLPCVVRGQGRSFVLVLVQQVTQVPRAVANVDLGVVELVDPEPGAACVDSDPLGGIGKQLHQADRA